MNKITLIISSAYSAIISSVFVVVITIWADLAAPLKDWLKSVTGHHWTTKSVFTALIFTLVMIILYALRKKHTDNVKKISDIATHICYYRKHIDNGILYRASF